MQIYKKYEGDVSFHYYNLEVWDSPVVVTWQCIQCRKTIKKNKLSPTKVMKSVSVYPSLISLIIKLFRKKMVIPSYCETCMEEIGTDLFCAPSDMEKIRQDIAAARKNFDSSLDMELEEYRDFILARSRAKHIEALRRKIQDIMASHKISREEFFAQLYASQLKKRSLKGLNIFYDRIDRYWKCVQENTDHLTALDECSQNIVKLANMIAEKYINTECEDSFWDGECRQIYKEYARNWNRWYKTLVSCKVIILYKHVSLEGPMDDNKLKTPLNGAEIRLIEQALPVGSAWLNKMEKLLAKSPRTKRFIATPRQHPIGKIVWGSVGPESAGSGLHASIDNLRIIGGENRSIYGVKYQQRLMWVRS